MPSALFTTQPSHQRDLRRALDERPMLIVGLCAAWCRTCDDFRTTFEAIAVEHADATFVWLDIEDDAALLDEVDVDDFPTLCIYHDARLVHFGVSLPQRAVVRRLIEAFGPSSSTVIGPGSIDALPMHLRLRPVISQATVR